MAKKRITSMFLAAAMLLSMATVQAGAADEKKEGPQYEAPFYNAEKGVYEISKPEHIMYMSGTWKEGAPRNGNYVLTNDIDMEGYEGFQPIASKKAEGYLGTFDGQFHAIKNLVINYPKKYVGLFGYVGNENDQAYIKNVALLNVDVSGQQNVGGIAGVNYGTITGCLVTGKVRVDDLSNSHTGGGIAGKVKEGEGPIIGRVDNCYADVTVEAPYDVGGIAGIQDGGGYVGHSFAAGVVNAYKENGAAGGIAGSFNAGDKIEGCVSAQKTITGKKNTDKVVGQLDDEAATNIANNIAWEGTKLIGNEPEYQPIKWQDVSAADLCKKDTYVKLGWDFENTWEWRGEDANGTPMLKGYAPAISTFDYDWKIDSSIVISRAVNTAKMNEKAEVAARVITPNTVKSATLYYGYEPDGTKLTASVPMAQNADGTFTASIPTDKAEYVYYYIKVETDKDTVTKPYDSSAAIGLYVDDGRILGEPSQITLTPGEKQGSIGFNWVTVPAVTDSVVKYKVKGESSWQEAKGNSYVDAVTPGWKELATHRVTVSGLIPNATYVYSVGDGDKFMSGEKEFKAPESPDADSFSFLFVSDPQSVSVKDYKTFKECMDYAIANVIKTPEFIMSGGDTTQDGYKASEWEACFEVMQDYYAKYPTITVPGNHEMKGDWGFVSFAQRFHMPGGDTGTEFDDTIGCFEYGDALIVAINTEVTPPDSKADIIQKQLKWAKECYEESGKKWRIMVTHAGPYTSNHDPMEVRDYFINDSEYSIDAMKVDLFLNGHDHIYIRSTVKGDKKVATGEGTTYITGGTVGNKFYEYMPDRSDYSTDAYSDKEDQQVFSLITVSKDSIKGTAYRKADPESFDAFEVIDTYEITNNLQQGKTAPSAKQEPENTAEPVQPAEPEKIAEPEKPAVITPADRVNPVQLESSETVYYTVVSGDYLYKIAPKYNTTWQKIAALNNLKAPYLIMPGQKLRVR